MYRAVLVAANISDVLHVVEHRLCGRHRRIGLDGRRGFHRCAVLQNRQLRLGRLVGHAVALGLGVAVLVADGCDAVIEIFLILQRDGRARDGERAGLLAAVNIGVGIAADLLGFAAGTDIPDELGVAAEEQIGDRAGGEVEILQSAHDFAEICTFTQQTAHDRVQVQIKVFAERFLHAAEQLADFHIAADRVHQGIGQFSDVQIFAQTVFQPCNQIGDLIRSQLAAHRVRHRGNNAVERRGFAVFALQGVRERFGEFFHAEIFTHDVLERLCETVNIEVFTHCVGQCLRDLIHAEVLAHSVLEGFCKLCVIHRLTLLAECRLDRIGNGSGVDRGAFTAELLGHTLQEGVAVEALAHGGGKSFPINAVLAAECVVDCILHRVGVNCALFHAERFGDLAGNTAQIRVLRADGAEEVVYVKVVSEIVFERTGKIAPVNIIAQSAAERFRHVIHAEIDAGALLQRIDKCVVVRVAVRGVHDCAHRLIQIEMIRGSERAHGVGEGENPVLVGQFIDIVKQLVELCFLVLSKEIAVFFSQLVLEIFSNHGGDAAVVFRLRLVGDRERSCAGAVPAKVTDQVADQIADAAAAGISADQIPDLAHIKTIFVQRVQKIRERTLVAGEGAD